MSRPRTAAVLVLAIAGISGCSGDDAQQKGLADKPAREVVAATAAAIKTVNAFHIDGELTDEDDATAKIAVDVVRGGFHIRLGGDAGRLEIVLIGDDAFFKGDAQSLSSQLGAEASRLFAGKWLKVPADQIGSDARELLDEFSASRLAYCLPKGLGTLENLGTEDLDGRTVIAVSDRGDKPGTAPGKLYVAAEGEPLPIRIRQTGPERRGGTPDPRCDDDDSGSQIVAGDIRFRYGDSVTVTPPEGAVDLSALAGEKGTPS